MRARAARWWLGALLLAVPLAGCGGQAERPSVSVGMFDNFYARDVTRVPAGTPLVFENKGYAPHNAVATDGAFRTPDTINADQSATVVTNLSPGVYPSTAPSTPAKRPRTAWSPPWSSATSPSTPPPPSAAPARPPPPSPPASPGACRR